MSPNFATYTKFHTPENAQYLIGLLQHLEVPYTLEHEVNQLDPIYIGGNVDPMFVLKIPGDRFNDVNALMADLAKKDMAQPGFEHYLQSYTTAELQEIVREPATWNAYDVQVATTLLSDKTDGPIPVAVNAVENEGPVKIQAPWIVLGYLGCLLGLFLFYWGLSGFFAGLAIIQAKKTLKNGTVIKMFTEQGRKHGRIMMALGLACVILGFVLLNMRLT
ncbi:MAG: hypothetical protein J7621_14770 [Niastella sp.]|nr:hypothetical protein [Niastella sp.]